jgi:predicted transcriptional regulator
LESRHVLPLVSDLRARRAERRGDGYSLVVRALDALRSGSYESLHELAKALDRDTKNVYEDVKVLESQGLVQVVKRNARLSTPRARVERIHITM